MARVAVTMLVCALVAVSGQRLTASAPVRGAVRATDDGRGLAFDASVDPVSRALIERAVASARPEAQRLIAAVDGLTTVRIGHPEGALGTTQSIAGGRYDVMLDLGTTQRRTGERGVFRLVLHELGHVVDFQLVPASERAALDEGVPSGVPCPAGTQLGSCAPRAERFAETFAKWAMGNDLGAGLYIGYAVPPPAAGFDAWAAPLSRLAAPSAPSGTAGR
jgi:hypothetical protein